LLGILVHFQIMFMSHYRHLLFDLDDTLWNFTINSRLALYDVYTHYQLKRYYPDFEEYVFRFEESNMALWRLYVNSKITKEVLRTERFLAPLRRFGILNEGLAKEMGVYYLDQSCLKTDLMPNTVKTLEYLSTRYELYIISNGLMEVQYRKLQHSGLSGYFDQVFLSEEVGYLKPDPAFFAHILSRIDAPKEECLVIGDNFEVDIEGAMNSGIDQAFYVPKRIKCRPRRKPTYFIRDLADLCSFL
jgi:YjjG family noncanonical pyrimidine nucleotidase